MISTLRRLIINMKYIIIFFFIFRELQEDECLRHAYRLHGIEDQTTNFHALDILRDII
jgi:hypothetical protein